MDFEIEAIVVMIRWITAPSSCSQPILPIEMKFLPEVADENDEPDLEAFVDKMKDMKKGIYQQVHGNIQKAQKQQKEDYVVPLRYMCKSTTQMFSYKCLVALCRVYIVASWTLLSIYLLLTLLNSGYSAILGHH